MLCSRLSDEEKLEERERTYAYMLDYSNNSLPLLAFTVLKTAVFCIC